MPCEERGRGIQPRRSLQTMKVQPTYCGSRSSNRSPLLFPTSAGGRHLLCHDCQGAGCAEGRRRRGGGRPRPHRRQGRQEEEEVERLLRLTRLCTAQLGYHVLALSPCFLREHPTNPYVLAASRLLAPAARFTQLVPILSECLIPVFRRLRWHCHPPDADTFESRVTDDWHFRRGKGWGGQPVVALGLPWFCGMHSATRGCSATKPLTVRRPIDPRGRRAAFLSLQHERD